MRNYFATAVHNDTGEMARHYHVSADTLLEALEIVTRWCDDEYIDCRIADISEEG